MATREKIGIAYNPINYSSMANFDPNKLESEIAVHLQKQKNLSKKEQVSN